MGKGWGGKLHVRRVRLLVAFLPSRMHHLSSYALAATPFSQHNRWRIDIPSPCQITSGNGFFPAFFGAGVARVGIIKALRRRV